MAQRRGQGFDTLEWCILIAKACAVSLHDHQMFPGVGEKGGRVVSVTTYSLISIPLFPHVHTHIMLPVNRWLIVTLTGSV